MKVRLTSSQLVLATSIGWLLFFFFAGDYYWDALRYGQFKYAETKIRLINRMQGDPGQERLSTLDPAFAHRLQSMYACEPQMGIDGNMHKINCSCRISANEGMAIYELCRKVKPKSTLEIGFAYGFSTIYFLAAIKANGSGQHTAIDPYEKGMDAGMYAGIGLQNIKELGMEDSFRFIDDFDFFALPNLKREKLMYDVIFIDGNHRFDDIIIDFTLSDYVCSQGGYILLDDLWIPSIQRAIAFIERNRSDYQRITSSDHNLAIFQKTGSDDREWNHFVPF
jgi:predicted O-methyltransferase YrrM